MTMSFQQLASGADWRVTDVVCSSGPADRRFEERHGAMCIAVVTSGTFEYRSTQGGALLAPGSLLLGNAGACFECGHRHGRGDRCVSFQLSAEFFERIVAAIPRASTLSFRAARLPPAPALLPLIFEAHSLREQRGDEAQFHELTMRLVGEVYADLHSNNSVRRAPTAGDERRVARALRRIEATLHERLSLADLAEEAASSPYHFLRVFEQVVGVTPGQYILRERLRRAAVRVRSSDDPIASIALDTGFTDLSTFNRHFRRALRMTPSEFRTAND